MVLDPKIPGAMTTFKAISEQLVESVNAALPGLVAISDSSAPPGPDRHPA